MNRDLKEKVQRLNLLVDGNSSPIAFTSTPANGDEHQEVEPLLDRLEKHISNVLSRGIIPIFKADKGYDAKDLRNKLLRRKIFPGFAGEKNVIKQQKK